MEKWLFTLAIAGFALLAPTAKTSTLPDLPIKLSLLHAGLQFRPARDSTGYRAIGMRSSLVSQ
jgi:hypothetical protein